MTPELQYDQFQTGFGKFLILKHGDRVCWIGLPGSSLQALQGWCRQHFPSIEPVKSSGPFAMVRTEIAEYMSGARQQFSFPVDLIATPFQRDALQSSQHLAYGERATYLDLAKSLNKPGAARAVGRAMATNPLPLVFPCHRVVGSDGSLTGYGGGLDMKRHLLAMEIENR